MTMMTMIITLILNLTLTMMVATTMVMKKMTIVVVRLQEYMRERERGIIKIGADGREEKKVDLI